MDNSSQTIDQTTTPGQMVTEKPWQPPIIKDHTPTESSYISTPAEQLADQTPEKQAAQQPHTLRPLTKKRKAFVKHYADPRTTATQAALDAGYSPKTAYSTGSELLKKPEIRAELAKYESKAEYNLMILADKTTEYALEGGREGAAYASVSEKVNNSILDRLKGKAIQRQQIETRAVTLNIDLTGTLAPEEITEVRKSADPTPPSTGVN